MSEDEVGTVPGLVVLDDPCRGCGACCEYMGVPPGYAPAYETDDGEPARWLESDDGRRWRGLPAELRAALDDYYRAVRDGTAEDRETQAEPCLWYDPVSRRCAHYEYRPGACRAFEAGGEDCLAVRDYAGR